MTEFIKDGKGRIIRDFELFEDDVFTLGDRLEGRSMVIMYPNIMNKYIAWGRIELHPSKNLVIHKRPVGQSSGFCENPMSMHMDITKWCVSEPTFEPVLYYHNLPLYCNPLAPTKDAVRYTNSMNYDIVAKHKYDSEILKTVLEYRYIFKRQYKNEEVESKFNKLFSKLIKLQENDENGYYTNNEEVYITTPVFIKDFTELHRLCYGDPVVFGSYVEKSTVGEHEAQEKSRLRIERWAKRLEEYEPPEPESRYLYLMKDSDLNYYKIGVSKDPKIRESTLMAQKPSIKLVGQWEDLAYREREWHNHFHRERVRGEWFDLTPAQVRYFVHKCVKGE